jgi:hypothetical protein
MPGAGIADGPGAPDKAGAHNGDVAHDISPQSGLYDFMAVPYYGVAGLATVKQQAGIE